ncbi:MAG: 2Fe-2S iron-sulfur cluster binding domain-containing protein [Betaproteobacteria bacterium]|jgi:ferredoxin|nr:2Fe-2S iron-sulfur cluster binding domain-containing protein [Betaproteobacteria bacterium]
MKFAENGVFIGSIEPDGTPFDVLPDATVLQAAERAGIDMPSSCRVGNCRTCISLLTKGQVRYQMAWPGLSAEEKAEGYILPCVAYPLSDIQIRIVGL